MNLDVDLNVDLEVDLDVDIDVDLKVDFDNGINMTRAVENAIRGCGPCSPEPEPRTGGGKKWF